MQLTTIFRVRRAGRVGVIGLFCAVGACTAKSPPPNPDGAAGDPLVIALTLSGPASGVTGMQGVASRLEVFFRTIATDPTTETILTPFAAPLPFAVTFPQPRTPIPIAAVDVPGAGFVTSVRITVDSLNTVGASGNTPIVIPGNTIEITPANPVAVSPGGVTKLLVPIDPSQAVQVSCRGNTIPTNHLAAKVGGINDTNSHVRADVINVAVKPGTSIQTVTTAASQVGSTVLLPGTKLFTLTVPPSMLLSDFVTYMRGRPFVDFTSVDLQTTFAGTFTTPPNDASSPEYFQSAAFQAHETFTGSMSPVVAILDSGVDLANPDLIPNIWINEKELPLSMQTGGPDSPCTGADIDCDGLITFRDLNMMTDSQLASFGVNSNMLPLGRSLGNPTMVDPYDLVAFASNGTDEDGDMINDDIVGYNFVEFNSLPVPRTTFDELGINQPNDDMHGTRVAGIVGAVAENAFGIAGVSPLVRLAIYRVCDMTNCPQPLIQRASETAVDLGLDIIDISSVSIPFTGNGAVDAQAVMTNSDCKTELGDLLGNDVPTDLTDYRSNKQDEESYWGSSFFSNLLIVRAAGNCPMQITTALRPEIHIYGLGIPGVQNTIGVSGMGQGFSSTDRAEQTSIQGVRGSDVVDIVAPYVNVGLLSSEATNGLYHGDGTSFSAPYVAGAAALILGYDISMSGSLRGNPAAIKARILVNADRNAILNTSAGVPGNQLVLDGNRLNVCTTLANGPCPFPYTSTVRDAGLPERGLIGDGPILDIAPP